MARKLQRRGFFGKIAEWECSSCKKEVPEDSDSCPFCKSVFYALEEDASDAKAHSYGIY